MKNKRNEGITLIALVVTIIVLLILAGISIAMLSGNNGILQRATEAKQDTERQSIIEQARIDVLGYQADNKGGDLDKTQLKSVLDKFFDEVPDLTDMEKDTILNTKLHTLSKYGTHTIAVNEIYNGNFKGEISGTITEPVSYNVSIGTSTYGTVSHSGNQIVYEGETITITATPIDGCDFEGWKCSDGNIYTGVTDPTTGINTLTFGPKESVSLTPYFWPRFSTNLNDWQIYYTDQNSTIHLIYKGYLNKNYFYRLAFSNIIGTSGNWIVYGKCSRDTFVEWLINSDNWEHIADGVKTAIMQDETFSSVESIYSSATITATAAPTMKDLERSYQAVNNEFKIGYYKGEEGKTYENYTQNGGTVITSGEGETIALYNYSGNSVRTRAKDGFIAYDPRNGQKKWKDQLTDFFSSTDLRWKVPANTSMYGNTIVGYWLGGAATEKFFCRSITGNSLDLRNIDNKMFGLRPVVTIPYSENIYNALSEQ